MPRSSGSDVADASAPPAGRSVDTLPDTDVPLDVVPGVAVVPGDADPETDAPSLGLSVVTAPDADVPLSFALSDTALPPEGAEPTLGGAGAGELAGGVVGVLVGDALGAAAMAACACWLQRSKSA